MGLYVQIPPYNNPTDVDPNLGRHDAFLMVGPYIFVQKTDNNVVNLYTSYNKAPFQKAIIPVEDPHQVGEIDVYFVMYAYIIYQTCIHGNNCLK